MLCLISYLTLIVVGVFMESLRPHQPHAISYKVMERMLLAQASHGAYVVGEILYRILQQIIDRIDSTRLRSGTTENSPISTNS